MQSLIIKVEKMNWFGRQHAKLNNFSLKNILKVAKTRWILKFFSQKKPYKKMKQNQKLVYSRLESWCKISGKTRIFRQRGDNILSSEQKKLSTWKYNGKEIKLAFVPLFGSLEVSFLFRYSRIEVLTRIPHATFVSRMFSFVEDHVMNTLL